MDMLEQPIVEVLNMAVSPGWRKRTEKEGVECFTKAFPQCSKEGIMMKFFVPNIRAADVEAFSLTESREFEYDTLLREKRVLESIPDVPPRAKVFYKRWASPVSALIVKPRDMVVCIFPSTYLTKLQQDELGIHPIDPPGEPCVFVHSGFDMSKSFPLQPGHVRGVLHYCADIAIEERTGVSMTVIFLVDPSGYVPSQIYNMFAHNNQIARFVTIRKLLMGQSIGRVTSTREDVAGE